MPANLPSRAIDGYGTTPSIAGPQSLAVRKLKDFTQPTALPTLWNWAEVRFDQLDLLIPREPEVHEPLPIHQPSHLLQDFNPTPVVFDQILKVVQHAPDLTLIPDVGQQNDK